MATAARSRPPSARWGASDLDAVVAIDAAIEGHAAPRLRRAAARRRAARAEAACAVRGDGRGGPRRLHPRARAGGRIRSHRARPAARDDRRARAMRRAIGVGTALFAALADWARRHGMRDLRTQAAWNDHRMLRWLDAMGFTLAPNHVVDCAVAGGEYAPARDDPVAGAGGEGPARDRLRRGERQRLRAARARHGGRALDGTATISPTSCASTAGSPAATAARTSQHRLDEAMVGLGDPRVAHRAPRRRDRRLPDGARRPGRLRPHRAGGGHRHDRRRPRLRAPRRRPRAAVAAVRQPRARCGSSASRRSSRRATSACWASSTTSGSRRRSGCRSCGLGSTAVRRIRDARRRRGARSAAPGRGSRGRHEHRRPRPRLRRSKSTRGRGRTST